MLCLVEYLTELAYSYIFIYMTVVLSRQVKISFKKIIGGITLVLATSGLSREVLVSVSHHHWYTVFI